MNWLLENGTDGKRTQELNIELEIALNYRNGKIWSFIKRFDDEYFALAKEIRAGRNLEVNTQKINVFFALPKRLQVNARKDIDYYFILLKSKELRRLYPHLYE